MDLSNENIQGLVGALELTREQEINCNDCLHLVAEFAEYELAGKPIPKALEAVQFHLQKCGECRDEYEALLALLSDFEE